jgi:Bacteriophage translational regulator.
MNENVKWSIEDMIEVRLKEDDDFLKVKETLTRIGIASRREKKLFQSCHILHKQVNIILFISKSSLLLMVNLLYFRERS